MKIQVVVDLSSLVKHYGELFNYRPIQSGVTLNITELPKDIKPNTEEPKSAKRKLNTLKSPGAMVYGLNLLSGGDHH